LFLHGRLKGSGQEMEFLSDIPPDFLNFILTALFALLIGLEQRRHHDAESVKSLFGTDRTFALIGILGFIAYLLDKEGMVFFAFGGLVLSLLLGVVYAGRIWKTGQFGLTSTIIALITYCLAPLIYTQPPWLVLLILIAVLVLAEIRENLMALSEKIAKNEFITLAKFIALAGIILPLTPREQVIPEIGVTPYKFWLAVVAVSTISYISYLLRKFVFPNAGIFFTGILGGLYSSTATTFTLARKTSTESYPPLHTASAILAATSMMYLRILVLAWFFNEALGHRLLIPFIVMAVASLAVAGWFGYKAGKAPAVALPAMETQRNPLEFRTALLFAVLFVFFGILTYYTTQYYGTPGLRWLSFVVGVTDIDPFILNLFQAKEYSPDLVVMLVLQATMSNNLLKAIYGMALGTPQIRGYLLGGFGIVLAASALIWWISW
jgi:uncharacterized membrane protein (DUF4010 family)